MAEPKKELTAYVTVLLSRLKDEPQKKETLDALNQVFKGQKDFPINVGDIGNAAKIAPVIAAAIEVKYKDSNTPVTDFLKDIQVPAQKLSAENPFKVTKGPEIDCSMERFKEYTAAMYRGKVVPEGREAAITVTPLTPPAFSNPMFNALAADRGAKADAPEFEVTIKPAGSMGNEKLVLVTGTQEVGGKLPPYAILNIDQLKLTVKPGAPATITGADLIVAAVASNASAGMQGTEGKPFSAAKLGEILAAKKGEMVLTMQSGTKTTQEPVKFDPVAIESLNTLVANIGGKCFAVNTATR